MRLTPAQLRALLDRYEAAETSVAEERALKAALAAPDVPEEFHAYRPWFGGLQVLAKAPAPSRTGPWTQRGAEATARVAHAPEAKVRSIGSAPATPPPRRSATARTRPLWVRLAVAAALVGLLGFGASLLLQPVGPADAPLAEAPALPSEAPADPRSGPSAHQEVARSPHQQSPPPPPIDWSKYEVTDPDEARRLTRSALAQVSTRLRRGSALTAGELGRLEPIHHLTSKKS